MSEFINVAVSFAETEGPVKPMHGVNNGPVFKFTEDQRITNIDAYREAGIPFARNHDASFCSTYGGPNCVDILAIFPNFDADENDPASYDFDLTDEYMKVTDYAGTKTFYRLGHHIEHAKKKYGTLVPKDFGKWARIAEHIIRHYTEGWADGLTLDVKYWEIWAEPDLNEDDADPVDKKCWSGTKKQFFEFYDVVAKHLKACFPNLMIGGPGASYPVSQWVDEFFAYNRENKVPMDFFSWHIYTSVPEKVFALQKQTREILDQAGFEKTESIMDEWNYVQGWIGDVWIYSLQTEKNLKGSSYIAAVISGSQHQPLDVMLYYDARPCAMNGLFSTDLICNKLKGYYPFWMFNQLYKLGTAVKTETAEDSIYAAAAGNEEKKAVMLTYFKDVDEAENKKVRVNLKDLGINGPARVCVYLLDQEHDADLVREETVNGTEASIYLDMKLFTSVLITAESV